MKKKLGITLLFIGMITTICGLLSRNGDRYKEEAFFDGFYGSETMNTVHTMIAVGIIMIVIGLILYATRNKNNDNSVNQNKYRNLNIPDAYRNDEQNISSSTAANPSVVSLLRRAEIFLEDDDFNSADEYFNRVLDIDPECAKAYIGRLLVELRLKSEEELAGCGVDITKYGNYNKAVRFADNTYKIKLEQFNPELLEKKENDRKEAIYINANEVLNSANTMNDYRNAANLFRGIFGYKDSERLVDLCDERAETLQIQNEKEKAELLERERITNEQRNKRNKKIGVIFAISTIIIITIIMIKYLVIPNIYYTEAKRLLENKEYDKAIVAFIKLDSFKDSKDKINECKYEMANSLLANNKYDQSIALYEELMNYMNSEEKIQECHYNKASRLLDNKQYDEAISEFKMIEKYKDSDSKKMECHYSKAVSLYDDKRYDEAAIEFENALGYKDSYEKRTECHYNMAVSYLHNMQYEMAVDEFTLVEKYNYSYTGNYNYKDSQARLQELNSIFKTYTNELLRFSIEYPIGFELDEGNMNQYNEIYISNYDPHIYTQIRLSTISVFDNIEDSYEIKLNQVTNENTNVYYKYLQGNEFVIYWRTSETEYYYRAVFDDLTNIAYFVYLDYGREDYKTCDAMAKRIINSFKILDE